MIELWHIGVVVLLVGIGNTAPAAMRPWVPAAGGAVVLAAIAPATALLLVVLTAIVLTAISPRGLTTSGLVVVIGSFLGYRIATALEMPVDSVAVIGAAFAVPRCVHVIVDVATVKDAAKHTAVFVVNLNFSFSLFSFVVLKLLLLLDDEEVDDGFVFFFSSSIVQQQ